MAADSCCTGESLHPILFNLGSFRLPTYGTLLVLAILGAIYTIVRLGRRAGLDTSLLLDFSTWLLVVALLGAKVLMILTDWSYYRENPSEILSRSTFLAGGVFYGGFLAAVFFAVWYIRVHHLPFWKVVDVYAPAIALGQSIGRLGCFAGGCDYGKSTTLSWGVIFTSSYAHEISGVPLGIRLHPTQVYESLATLVIFGTLLWRFRGKHRDGEIFLLYMGLYAVARFLLEFLRGDEDRGFVFNHLLSTSQFIAILTLAAVALLSISLRTRRGMELLGATPRGGESGGPGLPDVRRASAGASDPVMATKGRLPSTTVARASKRSGS
jgi:phosphatidylglycerol---prolipoprotein diacylglyceryl transferase